jgi:hypothetical protein
MSTEKEELPWCRHEMIKEVMMWAGIPYRSVSFVAWTALPPSLALA